MNAVETLHEQQRADEEHGGEKALGDDEQRDRAMASRASRAAVLTDGDRRDNALSETNAGTIPVSIPVNNAAQAIKRTVRASTSAPFQAKP